MKIVTGGLVLCLLVQFPTAQTLSGREILDRVDQNRIVGQAISVTTMIIHGRSGTRTIQARAWSDGTEKAFVEYLSPAREKGKKMLKLAKQIWIYTPEPNDRIIAISGHLLRQSVMGSDLSYEDMLENDILQDQYEARVLGQETLNDRQCYLLELTARTDNIAYNSRKIWVDSERYLPLKENRYARGGKLLKTTIVHSVFQVDGHWLPKKMTFRDMLSSGGGTEYIIDSLDFKVNIPDYQFTKAALRK